ncbi:MAG: tRNA (guanosine(37)-N1)-methyltransferase TrmD [Chloroflexi bacterium]|nr:tRNA (guanosine(37)-N1)-methyltransferase TrmD [Chloroflexota bacterium]
MQVDVVTLFPEMFEPLRHSIVGRAVADGRLSIRYVNPRDFTADRHRTVDDYPYGGGPGMVMKPEPLFLAVESVAQPTSAVILMSPAGRVFRQSVAAELAEQAHLILVCGHYEGVDERVREHLVTDEISIGDYVLTGGELAAMVIVDAVARLLPGVLGDAESAGDESHSAGLLEYPQYTRPPAFRGWPVPDRLLSGHHAEIAKWRRRQALELTAARRPDLMTPELLAELADDGTRKVRRRRPARAAVPADDGARVASADPVREPSNRDETAELFPEEPADDVRG